ncbi:MAG: FG-GAP-like repeat-containing protein [candidate division WOR-3 bacterium]
MLLMLLAYAPSYAWPTLGYDKERSSYQSVPGANITGPLVKWRVAVTPSIQRSCGPVIADVRGDYVGCEVLFYDGSLVRCLEGNTGNAIWSVNIGSDMSPNSTPAVGDVDNDGVPELIVARQMPGIVFCLNAMTGAEEWRDTVGNGQQIMAPVCLADVSGDNVPEIIIGQQFSDTVYCYNGNGTIRWKSQSLGISGVSVNGISAGNVDGAAGNEIIVAINDMTVGAARCIVCLNSDGTIKWKYPSGFILATASTVTATLGDVTGDGRLDVIVYRGDNNRIYALQGSNGSEIWNYSIPNNSVGQPQSLLFQNLVAWDVTGDGRTEVFFGTGGADDTLDPIDTTYWKSWFICLNPSGSERWRYEIDYWTYDGGGAICDVDNDGALEFVKTADDGFVYVFNAASGGTYEWRYDYYDQDGVTEWAVDNPIAVGDIDGDACSEIVLLGSGGLTGGNNITALDGPGFSCLLGPEEEAGGLLPRIIARTGNGFLYLSIYGFQDAEAIIWDASGRKMKELAIKKEPTAIALPAGIYFIEARHKEVVMRGKATVY